MAAARGSRLSTPRGQSPAKHHRGTGRNFSATRATDGGRGHVHYGLLEP